MTEYDYSIIDEGCKSLADRTNFEILQDKTVLIIGANGLIGSFLSDFFCCLNDHYSYNMKIILTSYSDAAKAVRVQRILHRKDVKYFSWDCSQRIDEENLDESIEYIFFCAGYGQPDPHPVLTGQALHRRLLHLRPGDQAGQARLSGLG